IVLDYGEHDADDPKPNDPGKWVCRNDPFSSYRAGFEMRTYRLCQRILVFHHFPDEGGVGASCLVRSLDLAYKSSRGVPEDLSRGNPVASCIASITQTGYRRKEAPAAGYISASLPPVQLEYSEPIVDDRGRDVDAASGDDSPGGTHGPAHRLVDRRRERVPGPLAEPA